MVASACQWLGVAIETASMPGSANAPRMSSNSLAFSPLVIFWRVAWALSRAAWSMSQSPATRASGSREYMFK